MACFSTMQGALSLLEELDTEVSQKEVEDKAHLKPKAPARPEEKSKGTVSAGFI